MLLKAYQGGSHEGGPRTSTDSGPRHPPPLDRRRRAPRRVPRVSRIEIFPTNPVVQAIGARQQTRVVATTTAVAVTSPPTPSSRVATPIAPPNRAA
jgi:hypothetical protein